MHGPNDDRGRERSKRNGYAHFPVDRDDKGRGAATIRAPGARFVIVCGDRVLVELTGREHANALHDMARARSLGADMDGAVFLGRDAHGPLFAVAAPTPQEDCAPGVKAIDMRSIATQGLLAPGELSLAGTGKSLLNWHDRHGFCANCGAATSIVHGGWRRECAACKAQHFPRVDPVVIMLAIDGDRALLARSPHFVPGMYSALAGFVEPGETIEDAVRRELMEEAGIETGPVSYHSSQPWPFPSSLMIGCFARARTREVTIDADEIEAAAWFSRQEIERMLAFTHEKTLFVPPPSAIAHQLLRSFVDGETVLED